MVTSWEYVAGFWDGEGCIWAPVGHGITVSTSVSQTKPKVLHDIKKFLDEQGIFFKLRFQTGHSKRSFNRSKDHHTLLLQGRENVIPFLKKVIPYLNTDKKTYAQDFLRFSTIFPKIPGHTPRRERSVKPVEQLFLDSQR